MSIMRENSESTKPREEKRNEGEEETAQGVGSDTEYEDAEEDVAEEDDSENLDDDPASVEESGTSTGAASISLTHQELLAKREYNRLCAAKSRANRKRKLQELERQVAESSEENARLTDRNQALRDDVDRLLQQALYSLLGVDAPGDPEAAAALLENTAAVAEALTNESTSGTAAEE